jgi:hypothetical protein
MLNDQTELPLERCPHCGVAKPRLYKTHSQETGGSGIAQRTWCTYQCATCTGVMLTCRPTRAHISEMWPSGLEVSDTIPQRARSFLLQAISSQHAPSGAVMLTASAVDAMLKDKGYKQGSLNSRIDEAAKNHLITSEMAGWAHEIRLDANDQRHADEAASLPTKEDAERLIEFASALAQFLYVLPARVARGRKPTASA